MQCWYWCLNNIHILINWYPSHHCTDPQLAVWWHVGQWWHGVCLRLRHLLLHLQRSWHLCQEQKWLPARGLLPLPQHTEEPLRRTSTRNVSLAHSPSSSIVSSNVVWVTCMRACVYIYMYMWLCYLLAFVKLIVACIPVIIRWQYYYLWNCDTVYYYK